MILCNTCEWNKNTFCIKGKEAFADYLAGENTSDNCATYISKKKSNIIIWPKNKKRKPKVTETELVYAKIYS